MCDMSARLLRQRWTEPSRVIGLAKEVPLMMNEKAAVE